MVTTGLYILILSIVIDKGINKPYSGNNYYYGDSRSCYTSFCTKSANSTESHVDLKRNVKLVDASPLKESEVKCSVYCHKSKSD